MSPEKFKPASVHIAYFISSHGFGHAARAAAIMARLKTDNPQLHFDIFTKVPKWFFDQSLGDGFYHHNIDCDVGFCQASPLVADIPATIKALEAFWPLDPIRIEKVASMLKNLACRLVICDIAPMGIAVAKSADLPSALIENFTWDWLYEAYVEQHPILSYYIDLLARITAESNYHIQTQPVCQKKATDLLCGPISRLPRHDPAETRKNLKIKKMRKMVLISMGGIPADLQFIKTLKDQQGIDFVIPGGTLKKVSREGNVVVIPHCSDFWHPDLIEAADGVVGKVGYSTLSEIYHAKKPFGYICRPSFRESQVLAHYVEKKMCGLAIESKEFESGRFLACIGALLNLRAGYVPRPNGAQAVAQFVERLIS